MLNLENYIFKGTSNNCDSSLLVTLFNLIGIDRNEWSLNSSHKLYWINNNQIEATNEGGPVPARQYFIDVKGLIELILSDHPELEEKVWWRHLKPGSKVVINIPSNESSDNYPCGIQEAMRKLDGETVTIETVFSRAFSYTSPYSRRIYFNGDYSSYGMVELPGYTFHSSMFLAPDTKPVKKLQLSSVSNSILGDIEEELNTDSKYEGFLEEILRAQPFVRAEPFPFMEPDLPW